MSGWHELVERDHDLQNPTTPEKIRRVGEYLRLGAESRVLDVACGQAGPALVLARAFGCRIHGVEVSDAFAAEARRRVAEAGLAHLVDVELAEAASVELEPGTFDAALCIGAAFVWGHVGDAAAALLPALVPGGGVAVGEPFWRAPRRKAEGFVDLRATVARFEDAGVELIGLVAASEDDWDRYESLHWRAAYETGDDDVRATSRSRRESYLTRQRADLGWAIFVGRKA
jgi:protein-L-isoaspartate O-methyltransferase